MRRQKYKFSQWAAHTTAKRMGPDQNERDSATCTIRTKTTRNQYRYIYKIKKKKRAHTLRRPPKTKTNAKWMWNRQRNELNYLSCVAGVYNAVHIVFARYNDMICGETVCCETDKIGEKISARSQRRRCHCRVAAVLLLLPSSSLD